ncbi:MAG: hypothetical protein ACU0CO_08560 [Shimia sp.]
MRGMAMVLAAWPVAAMAEPLDGGGIAAALTGTELAYEGGGRQVFYASGRTLYENGPPSWGYWAVRGDRYCSQWPPGEVWDCYDMDASEDGRTLRFVDDFGNATVGTVVAAP